MARKKKLAQENEEEMEMQSIGFAGASSDDDVLVIDRSWLIAAAVGIGGLIMGGYFGYDLITNALRYGFNRVMGQ